jgi:hypothetical protein
MGCDEGGEGGAGGPSAASATMPSQHVTSPHLIPPRLAASQSGQIASYLLGLTLHRQRQRQRQHQHALPTPLHAMPATARYGPTHRSLVHLAGRAGPAKRARADANKHGAEHGTAWAVRVACLGEKGSACVPLEWGRAAWFFVGCAVLCGNVGVLTL